MRLWVPCLLVVGITLGARDVRSGNKRPPPALAAPFSLTASDGSGLEIVSLEARAVVQDPLAFTELHLTFRNPQARTIEGQFAITLPAGAVVSRFAMRQGWGWLEGEVVERQAARVAYEASLHQRVDPALLEKQAGNEFHARVFPIPSSGLKEIVISYSQELSRVRDPYRLALRGLPRLGSLVVRVTGGHGVARAAATSLGGVALTQDVIEVKRQEFTPDADLEVDLPPGGGGLRNGNIAVARVNLPADADPDPPSSLVVLVDTSASRTPGFAAGVGRLSGLLRELAQVVGPGLPLRVAAFDQEVATIFTGTLGGFDAKEARAILNRRALGASDLGRALDWVGTLRDRRWGRVLVVSDGVATAGATEGDELRKKVAALAAAGVQRLDVVAAVSGRDDAALGALVAGGLPRAGMILDEAVSAPQLARRLTTAAISAVAVSVPGASWVWPERLDGNQPGDQVLIYADLPAAHPMQVVLRGARTTTVVVPTVQGVGPLLERAWVGARIRRLSYQRDTTAAGDADLRAALRKQIVDISTSSRVLCDFTAMLVLETDQDYARFGIDRRALRDILVVGPTGVEVARRGELPVSALADGRQMVLPPEGSDARARIVPGLPAPPAQRAGAGDRDHDRILDNVDQCPDEPETYNGVEDDDGCPDRGRVLIRKGKLEILDKVYFARRKSDIPLPALPLVDAIAASLNGNPHITLLEIQGHADVKEPPAVAVARAAAVVKALVARGVAQQRLTARGYGQDHPVCRQANEDCWSKNRRVEFLILKRSDDGWAGGPSPAPEPRARPGASRNGQDGNEEPRLREIEQLARTGKAGQAVQAAFGWVDHQPGNVVALIALGQALEAAGDRGQAARAYGSVIDLHPSQAELRRAAGVRLLRLADRGIALAVDSFRKARAQRPDHPGSHRYLAYALLRAGQPEAALDAIIDGLTQAYPGDRFSGVRRVLQDDAGLIGAVLVRKNRALEGKVRERLAAVGAEVAATPSLRFVVGWESDVGDVDLHVRDGRGGHAYYAQRALDSGGRLYADVTTGYGPECFAIDGIASAYPYQLEVHTFNHGPTGYGIGVVQVIAHDGRGDLRFDDRPFVLLEGRDLLEVGVVRGPIVTAAR